MGGIDWRHPNTRRLIYSYLNNWLLVVIMTGAFFALDKAPPFHREFSVTDKTIMFTYTEHEEVPVWALGIICFVAPFLIIAAISLGYKKSVHDFHSGVLGLCLALGLSVVFTQAIKVTVGRPRPDMLSRCQPDPTVTDPPLGLSNYTICTTSMQDHIMIDAFKSFPSGHSSFSFAGLGYLALYFAGKLRLFDERGHAYKGFTFIFPVIGALLVAITRTRDSRHHWQDVFIGGLLGAACAFFAYRQYHPALGHESCQQPFHHRFYHQGGLLPLPNVNGAAPDHHHHHHDIEDDETFMYTSNTTGSQRESGNRLLEINNNNNNPVGKRNDNYGV
ncbi:unnamed protein product [Absidia cylindrospora]